MTTKPELWPHPRAVRQATCVLCFCGAGPAWGRPRGSTANSGEPGLGPCWKHCPWSRPRARGVQELRAPRDTEQAEGIRAPETHKRL